MSVFGSELQDSEVVGSDGTEIGFCRDIQFNTRTGDVEYLLVEPGQNTPVKRVNFERTESNQFRVPADTVRAAKDRILVDH